MIRALSHDNEGTLYVLLEDTQWSIIAYPKGYDRLIGLLKDTYNADYQRLFSYPNGLGHSVMQRALRPSLGLETHIERALDSDTNRFLEGFLNNYWYNPFVQDSFEDYAKRVLEDFVRPGSNMALDDKILGITGLQSNHICNLPLVNVLSLTFRKGKELQEYLSNGIIRPRNTGVILDYNRDYDTYYHDNGNTVNVLFSSYIHNSNNFMNNDRIAKKADLMSRFYKSFSDRQFHYYYIALKGNDIISYVKL
ncbi:MAG: hypothetical protein ACMXYL_01510 [Candidatus Woesearchaeota archaeon]